MRKIKFRGFYEPKGEWIVGDLQHDPEETLVICRNEFPGLTPQRTTRTWYTVDPGSVGQFTGVVDREGNPIFEGDIVSVPYVTPTGSLDESTENKRQEVGFDNGGFVLLDSFKNTPLHDACYQKEGPYVSNKGNRPLIENRTCLKVLGNYFQNKELLTCQ